MTVSKIRLPDNTEHDIRAKYLIQSTSSDATSAEFSARTVTEDAIANIQKIKGNTIKWNQLATPNGNATSYGVSFTDNGDGSITVNRTSASTTLASYSVVPATSIITGHKYLITGCPSGGSDTTYRLRRSSGGISELGDGLIYTEQYGGQGQLQIQILNGYNASNLVFKPQFIDLTAIYGSGNEPSSVSAFRTQYPASYYPYDPGSLTSNSATAILSRGFNQFDNSTLQLGKYRNTSNTETTIAGRRCSDEYFPCIGGSNYNISTDSTLDSTFLVVICWYDSAKQFISGYNCNHAVIAFPSTAAYFRISSAEATGNICINISDPDKNGTYEPYNGHQIDLNIPTLTGKLNGSGSSVVIFSEGMKKAGVIQDEVSATATKRVMGIDLGTLTWSYNSTLQCFRAKNITGMVYTSTNNCICAPYISVTNSEFQLGTDKAVTISARSIFGDGTADIAIRDTSYGSNYSNFKTAMDGVYLYAEMATPEEYILDNALQLQYPVVAGGTEMVLPTTGTAPMKMDVIYGNAADAAATMSQNYISVDSMKEFLDKLGTQMGGTWSMGYENGKHTFTFTSN